MPAFGAFEPIGYATRADTVFEAVANTVFEGIVPGSYEERQARRLLARQNATIDTPIQPRVGQSTNTSAIMPPPTGDLFRNTSLEEPASTPAPVHPVLNREELQAVIAAENFQRRLLQRQQRETTERALQQANNVRADQCAGLLNQIRTAEPSTLAVFKHAIAQWKETDPREAAKFSLHFRNAALAASSNSRIWDIAEWIGSTTREVGMALRAVQKHYHKEAAAQVQLRQTEERCGGWSSRKDLDPEILSTVAQDRARGDGNHSIFGLNRSFDNISVFNDLITQVGEEKLRLHNIAANLEIRKTLLNAISYHGPNIKPRYTMRVTKFGDSLDCSIVQWCSTAIDIIKMHIQPDAGNDLDVHRLSDRVQLQIVTFSDSIDQIKLRETLTEVKTELMPLLRKIKNGNPGLDFVEMVNNDYAICYEAGKLRDKMLEYEAEHGEGILGTAWKSLASKTIGLDTY